jgi:uncharacterized protein
VADVAYLDSSAIVKVVIKEPESAALRRFLRRYTVHASSGLARAEVLRAVRRVDPAAVPRVHEALEKLVLVELTDELLTAAGMLEPPPLRTLDAIHLVSAQRLSPQLGGLVTYDQRMASAAVDLGFPVQTPA